MGKSEEMCVPGTEDVLRENTDKIEERVGLLNHNQPRAIC